MGKTLTALVIRDHDSFVAHVGDSRAFLVRVCLICFFFNDTATTEIYTLSLHDALPIFNTKAFSRKLLPCIFVSWCLGVEDRNSTRLNSSHVKSSYAVFCLKKKKQR